MNNPGKEATVEEYLDKIAEEYEHDMQFFVSKKPHLNHEAQNLVNKLVSSIRVVTQNVDLLKKSLNK